MTYLGPIVSNNDNAEEFQSCKVGSAASHRQPTQHKLRGCTSMEGEQMIPK